MPQIQTAPQTRPTRRRTAGQLVGRVLEPPFMRRLNARLIRQQPWLWSMRLHHAVYLTVLLNIVGLGLATIAPIRAPYALAGYMTTCVWLLIILQVATLFVWRYGQERYHVVREFGRSYDQSGWREFLGYALAFFLLMSSLPIFYFTVQQRIRAIPLQTLTTELLVIELNETYTQRVDTENYQFSALAGIEMLSQHLDNTSKYALVSLLSNGFWDDGLYEFLLANRTAFDTTQYRQLTDDPSELDRLLARYTDQTTAQIANARIRPMNDYVYGVENYDRISRTASDTAANLFSISAQAENKWLRNVWLITFALAVHFTLVRLVFKYNDRRNLLIVASVLFGGFFAFWFAVAIFAAVGYLLFSDEEAIIAMLCLGFIGLAAFTFLSTIRIPLLEQFKRNQAIQLVILPLLLVGVPYAIWGLLEISHVGYRFYSSPLYLYGGWVFYTTQFIYVPLIPYLKKRFVRLESLPRG